MEEIPETFESEGMEDITCVQSNPPLLEKKIKPVVSVPKNANELSLEHIEQAFYPTLK